jgi:hypothetical protein
MIVVKTSKVSTALEELEESSAQLLLTFQRFSSKTVYFFSFSKTFRSFMPSHEASCLSASFSYSSITSKRFLPLHFTSSDFNVREFVSINTDVLEIVLEDLNIFSWSGQGGNNAEGEHHEEFHFDLGFCDLVRSFLEEL